MKKRIKIQGFLIFLAVIALIFGAKYLLPSSSERASLNMLFLLGITLVLCGYFFRIIARGYKADLNPDGKTLVTQGPYALTRNPMYFGTLLIGLGVILAIFQWWVGLVFLLIYLAIYIPQINKEEKVLMERFGIAFKNYCQSTPKYFPNIFAKQRIRLKLPWIKKELSSLLSTLAFILIVKLWENLKW